MLELGDLTKQITEGTIDTVVVAFPDMQGRPVGKRVTGRFFLDHVLEHGIEACDYLLAVDVDMEPLPGYRFTNWESGYGDVVAIPDLSTLRTLPWLEGSAMVVCDVVDTHGAPSRSLRDGSSDAKSSGLERSASTSVAPPSWSSTSSTRHSKRHRHRGGATSTLTCRPSRIISCCRRRGEEYVLRRIRNEMVAADIPVEFSKGEAGRGQHEVNVTYGRAIEVADRHLVFKNGVKEIADQCGRAATFMAKWSMSEVGSSCHVHASIWDAESGAPRMWGEEAPSQLSEVGRQFVAGLLQGARQLTWLWAPCSQLVQTLRPRIVGAHRGGMGCRQPHMRLPPRRPRRGQESGVPDSGRRRQSLPGPVRDLRRGPLGRRPRLELPPPFEGNAYNAQDVPRVPTTLVEAIDELGSSPIAAEAFGDDVHHHLLNTARQEWVRANQTVTDWELRRNFERI